MLFDHPALDATHFLSSLCGCGCDTHLTRGKQRPAKPMHLELGQVALDSPLPTVSSISPSSLRTNMLSGSGRYTGVNQALLPPLTSLKSLGATCPGGGKGNPSAFQTTRVFSGLLSPLMGIQPLVAAAESGISPEPLCRLLGLSSDGEMGPQRQFRDGPACSSTTFHPGTVRAP